MAPRYLRKVDGTYVCRTDGEKVTSRASHEAQWHSLSPKPSRDGMSADSMSAPVDWAMIGRAHAWARGPWEAE